MAEKKGMNDLMLYGALGLAGWWAWSGPTLRECAQVSVRKLVFDGALVS